MKLKALIEKLEKVHDAYYLKHGIEPTVFDIEVDTFKNTMELSLSAGLRRDKELGGTRSLKPYMDKKVRFR